MKVKKNRDPEQGEQQNTSTDAESLELQQCSDPDPEYLRQLAQLYQGESFSGKPIINKVVPHDSVGKALPDPIYTVEWEIHKFVNIFGMTMARIFCKFTVATTDGCRIDWKRSTFDDAWLGVGGHWIKKEIRETVQREPSIKCDGHMECVLFDIDCEYEAAIRISAFRLLTLHTHTTQKWLRLCADGTFTWG